MMLLVVMIQQVLFVYFRGWMRSGDDMVSNFLRAFPKVEPRFVPFVFVLGVRAVGFLIVGVIIKTGGWFRLFYM